jgi:hypothetical protein
MFIDIGTPADYARAQPFGSFADGVVRSYQSAAYVGESE